MSILKVNTINEKTTGNGIEIAHNLKGSGMAGHVIQTVRTEYRTYTNTQSTSYVSTGITATITPKFATSKILITPIIQGVFSTASQASIHFSLYKGSSSICVLGTSVGYNTAGDEINYGIHSNVYQHEDAPSTTSATTYTVYWKHTNGSYTAGLNNYNVLNGDSLSTMTLQEIAQ